LAELRIGKSWKSYSRVLALALFITFDLIMFGAFVRISDAGLGCPDWPGCYGKATPLGSIQEIRAEAVERPHGPVTVFKAWIEMLHRYAASGLGLVIIWLAWAAWRQRQSPAHPSGHGSLPASIESQGERPVAGASLGLAVFTLLWVILQGLFGMWTVTLRLQPAVVTAHLLGGMVLFALLLMQRNRIAAHPPVTAEAISYRNWGGAALALLFVQIALGGWVSSNYATLACQDFPTCQGSWWPDMDIVAGFEIWRPLGMTSQGAGIPFPALTAIHYAHRLMAYLVLATVGLLAWRVRRVAGLERVGRWLLATLLVQLVTGLTNIFLDWPMAAAVLHTGGATALVGGLLMLNFRVGAGRRLPYDPSGA
jgi:cytochrome c oxidase assembly protein subunit 15